MAVQTRAKATRQRIVDVTVDLFYRKGYASVSLGDITAAAELTTGAFYYHFDSKEALGAEIIRQAWPIWWGVLDRHAGRPPALENLIALTFELSDLLRRDRTALVAQHLNLAFYQHNDEVRSLEEQGTRSSFAMLSAMVPRCDLREDVTPDDVAIQVSMNLFGSHVLSGRMGDSAKERLVRSWLLLLRGAVPGDKLAHFEEFVTQTAARYD